jgi:hypothetical protein
MEVKKKKTKEEEFKELVSPTTPIFSSKPEQKPAPTTTLNVEPPFPTDVIFNKDGTVTADGKVMSKADYDKAYSGKTGQAKSLELANKGDVAQQQFDAEQRAQQASQLGLTEQEILRAQAGVTEAPIDYGQALTAGAMGALPIALGAAVGGAATGAGVGALGGPIGAAGGALIGGIGGFVGALWRGTQSNIKSQQAGQIGSTTKVLQNAKTNMRNLRMLAEQDPANAERYVEAFDNQLTQVYRAQAKLKAETSGNLNKFMEDGTEKLVEFELFLQPGGYADIQKQRIFIRLASGVPASPEELIAAASEYTE